MAESVYTVTYTETSDRYCNPLEIMTFCDAGDVLLSGGCLGTADQWYFRVMSKKMGTEGWMCRAVLDRTNDCISNTVMVSAICSDITP